MVDILEEALNDQKDEKIILLFRKFLPKIIVLTIIGAIAVSAYNIYKARLITYNKQTGDALIDIITHDKTINDKNLITNSLRELIAHSKNRQAELASLYLVRELCNSGDIIEALNQLAIIINNKKYSEVTTSFARLLFLSIIIDQDIISEVNQVKAKNYMDFFDDEEKLFYTNATLLKALFYLKNDQKNLAKEYAQTLINSQSASEIVKEQAVALLNNLKNNL